ncbi:MAG: hypothetical protein WC899_02370 [bacterium]
MRQILWILALLFLSIPSHALAVDQWSLQVFGGAPLNFNLPLTIHQSGHQDLKITGNYESRAFEVPWYYAWRVGAWNGNKAWELELVHNKLYLENKPPEVQEFSISHGYNLLTVNRAWKEKGFIFRGGLGVVITHPETTVRGLSHSQEGGISGGYYLSGPTIQGAVEKRFHLWRWLIASLEGKLTASYARIPVEGGHADVPDVAVHGLFGLGLDIPRPRKSAP